MGFFALKLVAVAILLFLHPSALEDMVIHTSGSSATSTEKNVVVHDRVDIPALAVTTKNDTTTTAHAFASADLDQVTQATSQPSSVLGLDVSGWQQLTAQDWTQIAADGARFAYVKATEGTTYTSSQFSEQYNDSYAAGLIRGAYHFATPNTSSGAAQARFFVANGGGWTNDGHTLPPLLDIEYNPYGPTCYGLSQQAMVSWIADFSNTVYSLTGRLPAIYSTTNWWEQCTGNTSQFAANPLFIARYSTDGPGTLPAGWTSYTFWQYADSGTFPGDQDVFNGSLSQLQAFATDSSLFRTASNPNVYVVSNGVKYLVSSMALLNTLAPLGPVIVVDQSFLSGLSTGTAMGRIVGGPDGSIYFVDQGNIYHFTTCPDVAAWGVSCSSYIPLTAQQIAMFSDGGTMTNAVYVPSTNDYFLIANGQRAQAINASTLSNSLPGAITSLSNDAVSALPYAAPLLEDSIALENGGSPETYGIYYSGALTPISSSLYTQSALSRAIPLFSLDPQSFALVPQRSAAFTGVITTGNNNSALTPTGRLPLGTASWGIDPTTVSAAIYNALTPDISGTASSSVFAIAPGSADVYLIQGSQKRLIPYWNAYLGLAANTPDPVIHTVSATVLSEIPAGPAGIPAGTVLTDPTGQTYFTTDSGQKYLVPSATVAQALGLGTPTPVAQSISDSLPTVGTLTTSVTCNSTIYLGTGNGALSPASTAVATAYGITTTTSLDAATCATLNLTNTPLTPFALAPNGSIYYATAGTLRWIPTMEIFTQLGGSANSLTRINSGILSTPLGAPEIRASPVFFVTASSPTVYWFANAELHAILTWHDYLALAATVSDPTIYAVPTTLTTAISVGNPYIAEGAIVRTSSDPQVYMISGDNKISINSMDLIRAIGLGITTVPDGTLNGYATTSAPLTSWLGCNTTLIALGGTLYPLTGTAATWYSTSTANITPLTSSACGNLAISPTPPTPFLYVPASGGLYYLGNGTAQHIQTMNTYTKLGGSLANTITISAYTLSALPLGPSIP